MVCKVRVQSWNKRFGHERNSQNLKRLSFEEPICDTHMVEFLNYDVAYKHFYNDRIRKFVYDFYGKDFEFFKANGIEYSIWSRWLKRPFMNILLLKQYIRDTPAYRTTGDHIMSVYSLWKETLIRMMCVNRDSIVEEPPLYDDPDMETWFRNVCHMWIEARIIIMLFKICSPN